MSHITHFYHLAALDYIDAAGATVGNVLPLSGVSVVMPPWTPQQVNRDSVGPTTMGLPPGTLTALRNDLVLHYVQALTYRRDAHIAAAILDGKHPCQNAQVPGGFTTKPSTIGAAGLAKVQTLINGIRTFINGTMIPDLVTVARAYHMLPILNGTPSLFLQGYGCGNLLAYGAFPIPASDPAYPDATLPGIWWNPAAASRLFVDRSVTIAPPPLGAFPAGVTDNGAVNQALILEHVMGSSKYSSPSQLHPSVGQTTPNLAPPGNLASYTWHKAPRYNGQPHEVGPLARLIANAGAGNAVAVSDADIRPGVTPASDIVIPALGPLPAVTIVLPNPYTSTQLVTGTLTGLQNAFNALGVPFAVTPPPDVTLLMSILGRHAARVLEAKYLADAIGGAAGTAGMPMLGSVIMDPADNSEVYNYQVMPKAFKMGRGMTEAPRGALGHWITTEFRRIVNYQAVVPSTWNACGQDDGGMPGPIEQVLWGNAPYPHALGTAAAAHVLKVGYVGDGTGTTTDDMVNRILRAIHPFDICIACSVHMTDTKGNTVAKFTMDTDGKITMKEEALAEA